MDNLEIEGKEYISAKRAAREHSYTMDYVGQLIRSGKLVGKKVGRAWYVEQDSLSAYVASLAGASGAKREPEGVSQKSAPAEEVSAHDTSAKPEATPEIPIQREGEEKKTNQYLGQQTKREERESKPAYHYPMLRYVSDNEPTFPELMEQTATGDEGVTESNKPEMEEETEEYKIPIAISVAPESLPYRQEIRAKERGDRTPAHRAPILPALVGVAVVALILVAGGVSIVLSRTFTYESATASIETGFSYSNVFNKSR